MARSQKRGSMHVRGAGLKAAGVAAALAFFLGEGAVHAACADDTWQEDVEGCDDGNTVAGDGCAPDCSVECTEVGPGATDHTCTHGAFGPFVSTAAQKYPGFVYSDVSQPHTYFTVTLAGTAGVDHSGVLFNPGVSDVYAVYMKTNFPLAVRDSSGTEVPMVIEHAVSSCSVADSLTWVKAFKLSNEETYTLDIGPSSETSVSLALEYLPSFSEGWYRDGDQDGWGGKQIGHSWCKRPASYVAFGDDCDDGNGAVHPDAQESCDGVDENCDFSPDLETADLCDGSTTGSVCRETKRGVACGCDDDSSCAAGTTCNADTHQCESPQLGEGGEGGAGGAPSLAGTDAGGDASSAAGAAGSDSEPVTPGGASAGGTSSAPKGGQASIGGKAGSEPRQERDDDDSGCQVGVAGSSHHWGFGAALVALAFVMSRRRHRADG